MHTAFSNTCSGSYLHCPLQDQPSWLPVVALPWRPTVHSAPLTHMQPSSTVLTKSVFWNTNLTANLPTGIFAQNIPTNFQVLSHCPLCWEPRWHLQVYFLFLSTKQLDFPHSSLPRGWFELTGLLLASRSSLSTTPVWGKILIILVKDIGNHTAELFHFWRSTVMVNLQVYAFMLYSIYVLMIFVQ